MNEWITEAELRQVMETVLENYLKPRLVQEGVDPESGWLKTLGCEAGRDRVSITGADYAHFLEGEQTPGKMLPTAQLIEWTIDRFGVNRRQAKNIAFAIAHKIKEEGTEARQKGDVNIEEILASTELAEQINRPVREIIQKRVVDKVRRIMDLR